MRLAFVLSQIYHPIVNIPIRQGDSGGYIDIARNILSEHRFWKDERPTAYVAPGYPFFLALCHMLFGEKEAPVLFLQAILGSLSVVLLMQISKACFSPPAATLAAILFAIYPNQILYTGTIMSETLYIFLTLVYLWIFCQAMVSEKLGLSLLSGLALAAAILTRPVLLYFLPIAAIFLLEKKRHKPSVPKTMVFILAVALGVFPWLLRNRITLGAWTIGTSGGYILFQGNSYGATGGAGGWMSEGVDSFIGLNFPNEKERSKWGELEWDRQFRKKAFEFLRENPLWLLKSLPRKFWNTFRPTYTEASLLNKTLSHIIYLPVLFLALYSLFRPWESPGAGLLRLYLIYHILFHGLAGGILRYRLPLEPILIAFASAVGMRLAIQKGE